MSAGDEGQGSGTALGGRHPAGRYARLLGSFARYTLVRELAFRGNFLVKVSVEVLWLAILLGFYAVVFGRTNQVAGWTQPQYLFFMGCFFALNGLIETLFLENCNGFADLVRTGDLDFVLVRPIDEQFLVSCRRIDWGTAPNVVMGLGVMGVALAQIGWPGSEGLAGALGRGFGFLVMFACGTLIAYGFMLILTSFSVWMVRNQSLMEMWWLFSSLARYPKEIFGQPWSQPIGKFFTYVLPILLVSNVPADVMVRTLSPGMAVFTLAATILTLVVSRWFFRRALRSYRSASS
jgi:ABC-2 type transport system permease protein